MFCLFLKWQVISICSLVETDFSHKPDKTVFDVSKVESVVELIKRWQKFGSANYMFSLCRKLIGVYVILKRKCVWGGGGGG